MGQVSEETRTKSTEGLSLDPTLSTSALKKIDKMVEIEEMSASAEAQFYVEVMEGLMTRLKDNVTR